MPELGWLIKDLPPRQRPRERLLELGGEALSDAELVAIQLRTGHPGLNAIGLAVSLLKEYGDLYGLLHASHHTLRRRFGLGKAKAAALLSALEIARRVARRSFIFGQPMRKPREVAAYLGLRYQRCSQEVMGALYLNSRHRVVGEREVYRGTVDRAAVEPREILREGLLLGAVGVLLFHTHPSGDPAPSTEDLLFTRRMVDAGEIVGVRLVDHLVLGGPGLWVSLRELAPW